MDVAPWRHEDPEVHVECQATFVKVNDPISYFTSGLFLLNDIDHFHIIARDFQ